MRRVNHLQVADQLAGLVDLSRRQIAQPAAAATRVVERSGQGRSPIELLKQQLGDLYGFVSRYVELDLAVERRQLETYRELFCHRRDLYAQQLEDGSYFLKQSPASHEVVRAHLAGRLTAGWYALSPDQTARSP